MGKMSHLLSVDTHNSLGDFYMGEITNSENGGRTPRFLNDEKFHGPDDQPVKWHPKKTDKPIWIHMHYLGSRILAFRIR